MKTIFKIVLLFIAMSNFSSCTKEEADVEKESCSYKGVSYINPINQKTVLIAESKLFVGYIKVSSNGKPEIEIYEKNNRDRFMFLTNVINQNESGNGNFHLNGENYTANVTCSKAGVNIDDELKYTFTLNGKDGVFCVKIQDKI